MFASADMSRDRLEANIHPAQAYDRASGRYADHDDSLASWLSLRAGADEVSLRLTWEQLNALHNVLDALLTDHSRAAAPEHGYTDPGYCEDPECGGRCGEVYRAPTASHLDDSGRVQGAAVAGHSDPAEVLADRDPTAPATEPPGADTIDWTIHGWRVTLRQRQNGVIAVERIDGIAHRALRDFPTWPTLTQACDWLYETLERRPAAAQ